MENKDYFLTDLKRDVKDALHEHNYNLKDIENILRTAFEIVGDQLAEGNKVYLIDFFNFVPKDYKEKHVKNPQTGEPMVIDPYRTVLCKPTKAMKRKINKVYEK